MTLQINIPDDQLEYLSEHAKDELNISVRAYASDLIEEASRLETASRVDNGKPEITRSMIKDAVLYLKKYTLNRKITWGYSLIQILAVISILFTGGLFNIDKFQQDTTRLIIFLIVLTIAIVSNTAVIIIGRNQ